MIRISCSHEHTKKHGRDKNGNQRLRCLNCGKTFLAPTARPIGSMRIGTDEAARVLTLLLEGMSIRAVERITGLARPTICDLILVVGENCQRFLDWKVRAVPVTDVQCDELWSFVGMKEKARVEGGHSPEFGDSWTFIGIERNSKLVLAHHVGQRDTETCWAFLGKLKRATSGRFQISTDGLAAYTVNVPFMFGNRVDFAQLIKTYASTQEVARYSPAKIVSAEKRPQYGNPDPDRISTSHVERFNLTVRMTLRRFTRLTNGHSKSLKHHTAMQSIFIAFYNFVRKHEAIKGETPAMAAGLAGSAWTIRELLEQAAKS